MVWGRRQYILKRANNKNENDKNNISSKYINKNQMVKKVKLEEVVVDTITVAAVNMLRGRANSATNLGKFVVSDLLYEYALDVDVFERMAKSATGEEVSIPAKIFGLTLTNSLVNVMTGTGAKFTDAVVDSAVASAGYYVYQKLPNIEKTKA